MKFSIILLASLALLSYANSAPQPQSDNGDDFMGNDWDDKETEEGTEPELKVHEPEQKVEPKAAPVSNKALEQQQGPSHGSNFARYNGSCETGLGNGLHCNTNKNMVCDSGFCKCRQTVDLTESFYTYVPYQDNCYPISSEGNNWSCEVHEQCANSKLGPFSRCNGAHVCECYDTGNKARRTTRHDNICYVEKEINDQCLNDLECQVPIPGSVCLGLRNAGVCQCPTQSSAFDKLNNECVQLVSINETCKSQVQCNHINALGQLGFCNDETKKCECRDQSRREATGYLEGKCHFSHAVNETCLYREECVLGMGKNADCLQHPAYNDEKICTCPLGQKCDGTTAYISLGLMAAYGIVFIAKSMY